MADIGEKKKVHEVPLPVKVPPVPQEEPAKEPVKVPERVPVPA